MDEPSGKPITMNHSNPIPPPNKREIDRLVYDLYGLTEDEIAIVEGTK